MDRNKTPQPRQSPTIRDPRYPTVRQWLERQAKYQHRQSTGFTLNERRSLQELQTYITERKSTSEDYYPNGQAR